MTAAAPKRRLTMRWNAAINVGGSIAQLAVSFLTVPLFVHGLGPARYGVMAVTWLFLSYFGFFEMGVGRATAVRLARLDLSSTEAAKIYWTAVAINAIAGIAGGVILGLTADWFFAHRVVMPAGLRPEVLAAIPALIVMVPLGTIPSVAANVLVSDERFLTLNITSIISGVGTQLLPLAALHWLGPNVTMLITLTVAVRGVAAVPLFFVVHGSLRVSVRPRFSMQAAKSLFAFSAWTTISSLVTPILDGLDRTLISAIRGVTAVTYYTVPQQVTSKLNILVGSLTVVLMPRLAQHDAPASLAVARRFAPLLAQLLTLAGVIVMLAMHPFLRIWVGADVARESAPIGIILVIGTIAGGIGHVPWTYLIAQDRPRIIAIVHAAQVPAVIVLFAVALHFWGLPGAAWAWTVRTAADAILLFIIAGFTASDFVKLSPALGLPVLTLVAMQMPLRGVEEAVLGGLLTLIATAWLFTGARDEIFAARDAFRRVLRRRPART